jgi:hypothetical protein
MRVFGANSCVTNRDEFIGDSPKANAWRNANADGKVNWHVVYTKGSRK